MGYSFQYTDLNDTTNVHFNEWLEVYKTEVADANNESRSNADTIGDWNSLMENSIYHPYRETVIEPLLTTKWDQGTYYNEQCPEEPNGPSGHALVGCVAVAIGQTFKYYNHPFQGIGTHSRPFGELNEWGETEWLEVDFSQTIYDWYNMPDQLTESNIPVATLLYHCGWAINMHYTPDWSSAGFGTFFFLDAMENHFNYDPGMERISFLSGEYDEITWGNLIKTELDNLRPVMYQGKIDAFSNGHAWVSDGYTTDDYYHFNWGWSGFGDGYFLFYENDYTYDQHIIIGFHPNPEVGVELQMEIANKDLSNNNIYDTLSWDDLSTTDIGYQEEPSGTSINLTTRRSYSFLTNADDGEIDGLFHYKWNTDPNMHFLGWYAVPIIDNFTDYNEGIYAYYNDKNTVYYNSTQEFQSTDFIQFYDPWFIDVEGNQPDDVVPLTDIFNDGAQLESLVFLQHNTFFDDQFPIYKLIAPKYHATSDAIYEFSHWEGSGGIDFGLGENISKYANNTDVVFLTSGASFEAIYNQVEFVSNQSFVVDDLLIIPEGVHYEFPDNFSIEVNPNGFLKVNGTASFPCVFEGESGAQWSGITVTGYGNIEIHNARISDADIAINLVNITSDGVGLAEFAIFSFTITNCSITNNITAIRREDDGISFTSGSLINNNIISGNTNGILSENPSPNSMISINNNLFNNVNNIIGDCSWGCSLMNNVEDDPLFIGGTPFDYHLQENSPCIDTGDPSSPLDPDGTVADMGAFYFHQYLPGDVNLDVIVDVLDVTMMVAFILGQGTLTDYQFQNADLNQSGTINILDIIMLIDIILNTTMSNEQQEGTTYVTKIIKQKGTPPYVMDVLMLTDVEVAGMQMQIDISQGYKAVSATLGDYTTSAGMTLPYSISADSTVVKFLSYGMIGESYPIGNGKILEIGLIYEGLSRNNFDPAAGSISELLVTANGSTFLESQSVEMAEFVRLIEDGTNPLLGIPENYALHQAFSNPFNPVTTIQYDIPEAGQINIAIYDMLGREMTQLVNTNIDAGYHSVKWDATSYASGAYFVKMTSGDFTQTQKIMLVN